MENIQDEIDLVGESAASIDAYAATDLRSVLPYCRNIFSAHLNCSPHVSRRSGNVSVSFMLRIRYRVCAIALSANDPLTVYTKKAICALIHQLNQQVKLGIDTYERGK
jgi:hypothetical protein